MDTSLARDGASASAWYSVAGRKLTHGDLHGAIAAYGQCLRLEPRNYAALNNLGVALIRAGRFQEAIATLETALAVQPGYQRALANLGKALREAGHLAEAILRFREALVREPNYASALVNLGDALAATGELDESQQVLERAVSINPMLVENGTHVIGCRKRIAGLRIMPALSYPGTGLCAGKLLP